LELFAKPLIRTLRTELLEPIGLWFRYCELSQECDDVNRIRRGVTPMQMILWTQADASLVGRKMDIGLEIREYSFGEDDPVIFFDVYGRIDISFPTQATSFIFRQQPEKIQNLSPGRYTYYGSAMLDDGSVFGEIRTVAFVE
jgi:hypothetical protein